MRGFKILCTGSILMLAFNLSAEAKLYKWVDDKGDLHYGDVVPPEYASKDKIQVQDNKAGAKDKSIEIMSPETTRTKEEEAAKNIADKKALEEKERRVNALRNTYSNEKEIDLALERNLVLINARIESNNIQLKSPQSTLDDLKKEVDDRRKAGRNIPQSLYDDISLTEAKITRLQLERTKNEESLKSVKARFEDDKIIYRKIIVLNPVNNAENIDDSYTDSEDASDYPEYSTARKRAKKAKSRVRY